MCTTTSSCAHQTKNICFNISGFSDPFSDAVPVRAARSGLSGRAYPRDSLCRGAHMHTDLRRVFSSVGSFDCQGTGKIKESLPQM